MNGPEAIVLLLLAAALAVKAWCLLEDFWDFDRREQWRRDDQAQAEWDQLVRALGRRP